VETGRLGAASRFLAGRWTVAPVTPETNDSLRSKHPTGPSAPFGNSLGPTNGRIPSTDALLGALLSFNPDIPVRVLRRPVIRPDVQLLRLAIVAEGGD